jgi:hypothetical protein
MYSALVDLLIDAGVMTEDEYEKHFKVRVQ